MVRLVHEPGLSGKRPDFSEKSQVEGRVKALTSGESHRLKLPLLCHTSGLIPAGVASKLPGSKGRSVKHLKVGARETTKIIVAIVILLWR